MSASLEQPARTRRLRTQISVFVALAISVTVTLLSTYFINSYNEEALVQMENNRITLEAELEGKGVAVSQTVALAMHKAIVVLDFTAITTLINSVVEQNSDFVYGMVLGQDGMVQAHSDPSQSYKKLETPAAKRALAVTKVERLDT